MDWCRMTIGIYCIENKINNKKYIGCSFNIETRKNSHLSNLRNNNSPSPLLQDEWNKYGEENFDFYILEKCVKSKLYNREREYIEKYSSNNCEFGYNLTNGGKGTSGYKYSEEQLLEMSKRVRGENNPFYGKEHSEEAKKIMSDKKKEWYQTATEDEINNVVKNLELGRGKTFWTDDTIRKIRECKLGENNATSKLSEEDVISILKSNESLKTLSKRYGVKDSAISRIRNGKRWQHLKERYPELYD